MDERAIQPFFLLGAPKCGSTSLYHYVGQHPDVFFGFPKEPVFFELEYERGIDYYRSHYFAGWSGQRAVGDARAHHLGLPFVAERIAHSFPGARLVALLRDPAERAHSHWWHRYSRGLETLAFPEALRANERSIEKGQHFDGEAGVRAWRDGILLNRWNHATKHRLYLDLGYYAEQIQRYQRWFPQQQMLVLFFDDLARDPQRVTQEVWQFLGLGADRPVDDTSPRNSAARLQVSRAAAQVRRWPRPRALRSLVPETLQDRLRGWMKGTPARRPDVEPEALAWLHDHFATRDDELEALLERPLPWRRDRGAGA